MDEIEGKGERESHRDHSVEETIMGQLRSARGLYLCRCTEYEYTRALTDSCEPCDAKTRYIESRVRYSYKRHVSAKHCCNGRHYSLTQSFEKYTSLWHAESRPTHERSVAYTTQGT